MSEIKTTTMRLSEDTIKAFREIAEKEGFTHEKCLSSLLNAFAFQKTKTALIDRKKEIEIFEEYVSRLQNLYLTSLETNITSEEIVRNEFRKDLDSKETLIFDLNKEIQALKNTISENNSKFENTKNELNEKSKSLKSYDELYAQNKFLLNQMTKEKEGLLEKIKELESLTKENTSLKEEITALKNKELNWNKALNEKGLEILSLKDKEEYNKALIENLQNQIKEFKDDFKSEIKELKINFQEEKKQALDELKATLLSNYSAQLEVEKKALLLEKKQEIYILKSKLETFK